MFLDGQSVGKAPLPGELFVTPDAPHTVEAKAPGYKEAKQTVTLRKGAAGRIELSLAAMPSTGQLLPLDPANAQQDGEQGLSGSANEGAKTQGGPSKPLLIAGVASSATLVGAGVVFAIMSSLKATTGDEQRASLLQDGGLTACENPSVLAERCAEFESSVKATGTLRQLSVSTFVVGSVLGAATIIYALTTSKPKPKHALQIAPIVVQNGGAVVIAGRW